MDGINVKRVNGAWQVFDDDMQDGVTVPDRWTDYEIHATAEQKRREVGWYEAALAARHAGADSRRGE